MKKCNSCHELKEISEFHKDNKIKSGYRGKCKICVLTQQKTRNSVFTNVPKKLTCSDCNIEKLINEFYKCKRGKYGYFSYCKLCHEKRRKIYVQENKVQIKEYQKQYKIKYSSKINEQYKHRYMSDMKFHLKENMRKRASQAIRRKKSLPFMKYLNCCLFKFKVWLQYQFTDSMTWENYGNYWQIDHVIPCSSFDFSKEDDIHKCFIWKNCRPYERLLNNIKNGKIDQDTIEKHEKINDMFQKIWNLKKILHNELLSQ